MLTETLAVICTVCAVMLTVALVLVALHTARDSTLERFKFRISASLMKICSFGIEIESESRGPLMPCADPSPCSVRRRSVCRNRR
jgi:hypothetical protein